VRAGFKLGQFFLVLWSVGCVATPDVPRRQELAGGTVLIWKIVSLPTRPGVQQRILIGERQQKSRSAMILFPGSEGAGHFSELEQGLSLSDNFLVRSSHVFALEGFTVAIVDVPSDHSSGMPNSFRASPEHARDIGEAVSFLAGQGYGRIFLVGTSRGTLSAADLATRLRHDAIRGIVLSASYDEIGELPLEATTYPTLFVHHRDDSCYVTPYSTARRYYDLMTSSPRKNFVTVTGGQRAVSQPCKALSAHGFLGKEREVAQVIAHWATGAAVPTRIGP
jgi:hypothetical protein